MTGTERGAALVDGAAPAVYPGAFGAVLVDLDGVLVDSRRDVLALWHTVAAEHGRDLSPDDTRRHVLGCAIEHTVHALFGELDPPRRAAILDRVRAAEPELGFEEMPGAGVLVRDLHRAGVRLALVTGASPGRAQRVLDRLGIGTLFGTLVAWGDVRSGKPAPDCYLLAASRLAVDPRRCLVLEDAPAGVTAARSAGASCVGVSRDGAADLAQRGARPVVGAPADLRCTHSGRVVLTAAGQRIAYLDG